jgi:hypothetical protein
MDNADLMRTAPGSSVSRAAGPQKYRADEASLRRKAEVVGGPEIRRELIELAERFERRAASLEAAKKGSL